MSEKGRGCGKVGCRVEKSPDRFLSQPTDGRQLFFLPFPLQSAGKG